MKQIIQNYKDGKLQLVDVPPPAVKKGCVLVQNAFSIISIGTEKHMLEMGKKSLLGKAIARPDLTKRVLNMIQTEGLFETYKAAMARLDNPVPLGYSSAGIVINVPNGVEGIFKGDRFACGGSGYASHAEILCIPENLCVKIPDNVDLESASFAALGAIALQAIRIGNPSLGDKVAVIGLGLLGQITVQLLKAAGCHVFAIDISEEKIKKALENGAEKGSLPRKSDILNAARSFAPKGFDSIIIMAASKTNEPLELSAQIARERARIVAAGLVGLNIPRKIFFEKELELVVSRAWGPGLFDPLYTEKNIDYPYSYARWTSQRNMEEFLNQLSKGSVNVKSLITHRFPIEKALEGYDLIFKRKEPYMAIIIEYPRESSKNNDPILLKTQKEEIDVKDADAVRTNINIGMIGAGLFATGTILPILKSIKKVRLKGVATATGIKARHIQKKFGFEYFTTNYKDLLNDNKINLIFVLTRHGSHSHIVTEALRTGRYVFVEKPLCINEDQLKEVISTYGSLTANGQSPFLMVGFNRRFSPFSKWLKEKFDVFKEPLSIHCTINAGSISPDSWLYDREEGGGRIIGEVCHFIDLIQYLTNSYPIKVYAETLISKPYKESDNVSISLKMKNGSIGSILYVASGDKRYSRERIEIVGGGAVGVIENFKRSIFIHGGKKSMINNWLSVDRGHKNEIKTLISAILNNKPLPISFQDYISTTLTTFSIEKSLKKGIPIFVNYEMSIS